MPPKKKAPNLSPEALGLVAQRFRVLSDPTRLGLLQSLFEGERTVQELCRRTGAGQANASKHLGILAREGFVTRRKEGLFVYYSIADESVFQLCEVVCGGLAEKFAARAAVFNG
jgi:ArsR family transcriptional regulator